MPARRRGSDGQGTGGAFAKVLSFDSESVIEAGAIVLPRDGRGERHQLPIGEAVSQFLEKRI